VNFTRRSLAIACLIAWMPAACVFAQRAVERSEERAAERAATAGARAARRAAAAMERARATDTPLERWNCMTPEERQRALARLPPERRRELQQKLQQFRSLPPEERQQLRERYQAFRQLPQEQQAHARELFRQFNSLPKDRRPIVRREYKQLRAMSGPERNSHMNSEAFRSRFNAAEQQMLQDLARTFGYSP
jgi:hypothetical protein